jgi:hypothetical protein
MKKLAALTLSLFLSVGTAFADSPKDTPKDTPKDAGAQPAKTDTAAKPAPAKTNAEIAAEMEELRQALEAQQEQLQLLKEELAKRDRQIEEAREAAATANSRATEASAKASEAAATSAEAKTATTELNTSVANLATSTAAASAAGGSAAGSGASSGSAGLTTAGQSQDDKGPLTIRFKGVSITPGGFVAAETVNRQRALGDDINTQFNSTPYGGNGTGKLSELSMTARQSRLSLKVDGDVGDTKLTGYYEADWLGTGVTSNDRQSNSYVFRQRQIWGRATLADGWSFTGGQMWSLVTEDKKGIATLQEWIPLTIDPQYVVGFDWARQYGFRVTKSINDQLTLAVSAENPELTGLGGRGFSTYTSTSATGVVTTHSNAFVFAPGAGGGLYNFSDTTGYSLNKTPDFVFKAAFDPGFGHYELFGLVGTARDRVYPCAVVGTTAKNFPTPAVPVELPCGTTGSFTPSVTYAYNNQSTAGGVGGSVDVPIKTLDVGLKVFYGDGEGRYGSAQLPEVTLRPDGTLSLIHGGSWLGRVEWHLTPKLDLYGYLGGEYAARAAYSGYQSVTVVNTPAIPGCGAIGQQPCAGGGIQPAYPALTTTSISLNGIGGYGSKFANNSGCGVESLPSTTVAPGGSGTCAGDTRYIMEGTLGFWHKIYNGEKGRLQWGIQYSYLYKTAWSGSGGLTGGASIGPHATNNMFFTSFRYYLP